MRRTVAMLLLVGACRATPQPVPDKPGDRCQPAAMISPGSVKRDFMWQQRITATFPAAGKRRAVSFVAVVQKQAHMLTVLGLTPWGTRAFRIEQDQGHVRFDDFAGLKLPFSPRHIIADIHRVFFYRLSSHPLPDGTHRGVRNGVQVVELWESARLRERRLTQRHCHGDIVVTYVGGMVGLRPPKRIRLHHTQFGYTLDIVTLQSRFVGNGAGAS